MTPKRFNAGVAVGGLALSLSGCGRPCLVAGDVIVKHGQRCELAAFVDNTAFGIFSEAVAGTGVEFHLDEAGQALKAKTGGDGSAELVLDSPPGARRFVARTKIGEQELESEGAIFQWDPNRVAIAVDLDETISATEYIDLLWGNGHSSRPYKGSVETLNALAKHFHILYYSARPRLMIRKTREWLARAGFPPGPILFAQDLSAAFDQGPAKRRLLAELRQKWPNVLIGIGDKQADVQACAPNGMLPVIVNPWRPSFREGAVVVADWEGVADFFEREAHVLKDPRALAARIEHGG